MAVPTAGVLGRGEHDAIGERGVLPDTVRSATVTAVTHMISPPSPAMVRVL